MYHTNENNKKTGVVVSISDKIDLTKKNVTRNDEEHYIMINRSIQEESITFTNISVSNIGATKYIKQITNKRRN